MKATIFVTLDNGTVVEGSVELSVRPSSNSPKLLPAARDAVSKTGSSVPLEFDLDVRPFMKKYGSGLAGPEKLILIVAHFAKGMVGVPVPRADVIDRWNRMKSIMGGAYNGAYDTRARDTGWLHSPKSGVFELRAGWEKFLR